MPNRPANALILSPIHQIATQRPDSIAYKISGHAVSYQQLSQYVVAIGEQLKQAGLQQGNRVACIANNSPELLKLYWACVDHGLLFCPVSPRFAQKQLIELIQTHQYRYCWLSNNTQALLPDLKAKLLTLGQDNTRLLEFEFGKTSPQQSLKIDPAQAVDAILTSGSTGLPKAAVHSLQNHIASAKGAKTLIDIMETDSWLLSLPLFHIGGLAILNRCALVGACVVFEDKSITLAEQLTRDQVSHLSLVSAQLQQLLSADTHCFHHVKAMLLGGGAISADLLNQLAVLNINAFTSYGMTEMGSQITTGIARADSSSGQLLPQRELKIVDGEIWLKGDCLFLGYLGVDGLNKPQDTSLEIQGWFRSTDLGHWDKNGNLCIDGRLDNMFVCGGENLQPEEIEAVLKQHPLIADAIVFAKADDKFGHLPVAIIKLANDLASQPSEAELTEFLADKIARFKRPRYYYPWPDVATVGIKVVRKQIIEAVKG
ncbi:o-succinylbenzoate--CoA ligase [Shewanella sp. Choline-02u-19]|uniref:o-succinylbenzoate--CoA ligase n=1 Tax=unclassified Shewanella TaxID=196818 RepID=UPI000C32280A|nr:MULTISPECIES: o-succinylbenzoate--CoA ligase [unclassified Shewanella]PKH57193.1 o-succinylbenzoate--CoA ligase [Shewanella sp. Bg11-22]PKI29692.1 o-succinylbenzoate--CoA ligase [Shewanella sp. Choline-02u-19]